MSTKPFFPTSEGGGIPVVRASCKDSDNPNASKIKKYREVAFTSTMSKVTC